MDPVNLYGEGEDESEDPHPEFTCPDDHCPGQEMCVTCFPDVGFPEDSRSGDSNWKDTNPKDAAAAVQGKVPLGLFPDTARIAGAMSMWEGANKYGQYNYRVVGVRASVYLDALDRHVTAYRNGEDIDPDSGLPHTWKALACLAVLIDANACGMLTDDRPPKAPVAEMLKGLQESVQDIRERLEDYDPHQYTIADTPDQEA